MTPTNNTTNQFYFFYDHNQSSLNKKNSQLTFNDFQSMKFKCHEQIQNINKNSSKIKQLFLGQSNSLNDCEQLLKKIDDMLIHQFTNLMDLDDHILKNIFSTQLLNLELVCKRFKKLADKEASKLLKQAQQCPDFNKILQKALYNQPKNLSYTRQWKKTYFLFLKELSILPKNRISNYKPKNIANLKFDELKQLRTWHRAIQFIAFFNCIHDQKRLNNNQRMDNSSCAMEIEFADVLRENFEKEALNQTILDLKGLNLTRIPNEVAKLNHLEELILTSNPLMYWNEKINFDQPPNVTLDLDFMRILDLKEELEKSGWEFGFEYKG